MVLTAALSSLNAGLYSTGRILRSMSVAGSAPKFAQRMNKAGVPYGGIAITAGVSLLGVPLNYLVPSQAFEIVLNIASVGIVVTWATIVLCQIQLKRWADKGWLKRPSFRMFGAPYTGYLSLLFLLGVLVMVFIDSPLTLLVTLGLRPDGGRLVRLPETASTTSPKPAKASPAPRPCRQPDSDPLTTEIHRPPLTIRHNLKASMKPRNPLSPGRTSALQERHPPACAPATRRRRRQLRGRLLLLHRTGNRLGATPFRWIQRTCLARQPNPRRHQ